MDVFTEVHSGGHSPLLSELDAVKRCIASVYLSLPTGERMIEEVEMKIEEGIVKEVERGRGCEGSGERKRL